MRLLESNAFVCTLLAASVVLVAGTYLLREVDSAPGDWQHQQPNDAQLVFGGQAGQIDQLPWLSSAVSSATSLRRKKRESPCESKPGSNPKKPSARCDSIERECARAHNKLRKLHHVGHLWWDKKIAAFARKRADHIAASDGKEFNHPPNLPYGENLAGHSVSSTSCSDLVQMWYDEIKDYDFKNGGFSASTGHFTQLVWRSTKRIGCATAVSKGPKGWVFLVCNYDPPGNFQGEYQENVFPKGRMLGSMDGSVTSTVPSVFNTTTSTARTTEATPLGGVASSTALAPTTATAVTNSTQKPAEVEKKKKKKNKSKKKKNKKNNEAGKRKTGNKKKKNKKNKKPTNATSSTTTTESTR